MEIKQGIRRNFARRAASYDRHAGPQRFMAQELLGLTADFVAQAGCILEVGCGTGYLTRLLRRANGKARLVALDLDEALVSLARRRLGEASGIAWLVADGETLGQGSFDLIIANATFQWLTRPGATLAAYFRSLKPSGMLAFSTLGPRTFRELAAAIQQGAGSPDRAATLTIPAQNFLSQERWSELLGQAGFSCFRLEQKTVTASFPSVADFLKTLQATGATNPRPRAFSSRLFHAMIAAYERLYRRNGSIPATYEMIWAVARKD
jgi:malonyl-CoA O-methyltransferase